MYKRIKRKQFLIVALVMLTSECTKDIQVVDCAPNKYFEIICLLCFQYISQYISIY